MRAGCDDARAGGQYFICARRWAVVGSFTDGLCFWLFRQELSLRRRAFGKFLGVFFPSISSRWIGPIGRARVSPLWLEQITLGNMNLG